MEVVDVDVASLFILSNRILSYRNYQESEIGQELKIVFLCGILPTW